MPFPGVPVSSCTRSGSSSAMADRRSGLLTGRWGLFLRPGSLALKGLEGPSPNIFGCPRPPRGRVAVSTKPAVSEIGANMSRSPCDAGSPARPGSSSGRTARPRESPAGLASHSGACVLLFPHDSISFSVPAYSPLFPGISRLERPHDDNICRVNGKTRDPTQTKWGCDDLNKQREKNYEAPRAVTAHVACAL